MPKSFYSMIKELDINKPDNDSYVEKFMCPQSDFS